jgi:hypothetical protein
MQSDRIDATHGKGKGREDSHVWANTNVEHDILKKTVILRQ